MSKFRKKPVVIDAVQWFPGTYVDGVTELVHDPGDGSTVSNGYGSITTLEGPLKVSPGDWIITGVKGERYPCKPDIFAETYEPVSVPVSPPTEGPPTDMTRDELLDDALGRPVTPPDAPVAPRDLLDEIEQALQQGATVDMQEIAGPLVLQYLKWLGALVQRVRTAERERDRYAEDLRLINTLTRESLGAFRPGEPR